MYGSAQRVDISRGIKPDGLLNLNPKEYFLFEFSKQMNELRWEVRGRSDYYLVRENEFTEAFGHHTGIVLESSYKGFLIFGLLSFVPADGYNNGIADSFCFDPPLI